MLARHRAGVHLFDRRPHAARHVRHFLLGNAVRPGPGFDIHDSAIDLLKNRRPMPEEVLARREVQTLRGRTSPGSDGKLILALPGVQTPWDLEWHEG